MVDTYISSSVVFSAMTSVVSLYVGKLPMDVTRPQVQELFEPYRPGRIDLRHGKSYDFGFVEIPAEMADEAVSRMHRLLSCNQSSFFDYNVFFFFFYFAFLNRC